MFVTGNAIQRILLMKFMKTRISWRWTIGLLLAAVPLVAGCAQSSASADTTSAAATNVAVPQPVAAEATGATNAAPVPLAAEVDISQAPAKPIIEPIAPAALQSNRPVLDIVKLANSSVDEGVMVTYVTNSPSAFNLTADDIIYLKDIGVPDAVIKSMILRDQELKAQGVEVGAAPAVGPTYEWTQPPGTNTATEPAPAPAEVAPQYQGTTEPQPAPTAPTTVTYSTFYDSLSPYGTWIEVDGYGRVWQPTVVVVNRSWRPYFDSGRWVYTDQGWYWLSDYSWGWAPFHYGRWFNHHHYGWCWAPDLVWGPSWVTWRYNNAYCGWAPLPPAACYYPGYGFYYYGSSVSIGFGWGLGYSSWCFVNYNHFHHHGLHAYRVPDHQARPIYDSTTPVNRIVAQNNLVVNRGVPPENISAVTRQEIRRVTIRDSRLATGPGGGPKERLTASGRSLEVFRPTAQVQPDDPGIVQRSRREISRNGNSAVSAASAPSAPTADRAIPSASAPSSPLAERSTVSRPAPNASATSTRGTATIQPAVAPAAARPQAGRTPAVESTRTTQPVRPAVEATRPAAPDTQASVTKPAPSTRGNKPGAAQPIILRGSDFPRSQPVTRTPAPATQTSPTVNREERPATVSRPEPARTPAPAAPLATSVPRVEPRTQNPAPARTWQRTEPARPATPPTYTAPATTRTVPQAPQRTWSTPAPAARPQPSTVQRTPTYTAPTPAPRPAAPAYQAPSRPVEVPRAAPVYQAPSRPVQVPRAAPAPSRPVEVPRAAPAPAPSAPSAPSSRGSGNSRANR